MKNFLIVFLVVCTFLFGCKRKYHDAPVSEGVNNEKMVEINRSAVHDEAKAIQEFIERHGWKMQMTGTGLHYEIYEHGKGLKADSKQVLTITYRAFLLDGTLCYEANEKHPLSLVVGSGQQINGLEEGLMLMNEGDRARFVIPNHLAYGITGDQEKIPPASALYYDVHLIKTQAVSKNESQK